jgi:hypothetical protein
MDYPDVLWKISVTIYNIRVFASQPGTYDE